MTAKIPPLTAGSHFRRVAIVAVALWLGGCATLPPPVEPLAGHLEGEEETAACAGFLRDFDQEVVRAGVADAQYARIPGFPYLRASRFLASFRHELNTAAADDPAWPDWLAALRERGRAGHRVELANLPDSTAIWQRLGVNDRAEAAERLDGCGDHLLARDRASHSARERLPGRSRVPDAYADYLRWIGLYPLTALAVADGVSRLHADIAATFRRHPEELPVRGELIDYGPPAAVSREPIADWYRDLPRDGLGVPQLTAEQKERLFDRYAPVWRIDVAQPADRIGMPRWAGEPVPTIEFGIPVVFRLLSHTRWRGRTLLQLNYVIWFPARPKTGALDLLGGPIDGITWRVTLGHDGEPLLYDAMHNCGCYHMAFPSAALQPRTPAGLWQEPLLVPGRAPALEPAERIRIRIEQGSHYLQALETVAGHAGDVTYQWRDYDTLRSLPVTEGGRRSLFNENGLVPGSERLERWLLWPMGVPEPGAMRQWGTHATAFVGKRHFDDPDLIERYFQPLE